MVCFVFGRVTIIRYPTSKKKELSFHQVLIKIKANSKQFSRSRAVGTERTILSPFTKEYRVLAADSGIRLFLEGFSSSE